MNLPQKLSIKKIRNNPDLVFAAGFLGRHNSVATRRLSSEFEYKLELSVKFWSTIKITITVNTILVNYVTNWRLLRKL